MPELDFDRHNTGYATHGLHAFAAKCPPQLARYAIRYYSSPGDTVFDPMAGSGTTLVEARLMGRVGIGLEIDPVARLIAKVKATPLVASKLDRAAKNVAKSLDGNVRSFKLSELPAFHNRDYWFSPSVSKALMTLSNAIAHTRMAPDVRDFLWVVLSSLILARSSVANARDIIHSRHHHVDHAEPPNVIEKFWKRFRMMRSQVEEFTHLCARTPGGQASIMAGDARKVRLADRTVDLVFTSPPYATALDYPRAHFLAVPWLAAAIKMQLDRYLARGSEYIGSARGRRPKLEHARDGFLSLPKTQTAIQSLLAATGAQASIIGKYFADMGLVLREAQRVLKPGGHLILVVCPSHIRKIQIPTNRVLTEMSESVGLKLKAEHIRTISERRRVLPYINGNLQNRMETEYVLVLKKT